MKAKDLERLLALFPSVRLTDLEDRNSYLRKAGLLPKGGRGPYAPTITARDAAVMLLGLAASVTAIGGPSAVENCGALEDLAGGTFLDEVEAILGSPSKANDVFQIRIYRHTWIAEVQLNDGSITRFMDAAGRSALGDSTECGSLGPEEVYFFGAGILHQIACDLEDEDDPDDEWVAEVIE